MSYMTWQFLFILYHIIYNTYIFLHIWFLITNMIWNLYTPKTSQAGSFLMHMHKLILNPELFNKIFIFL